MKVFGIWCFSTSSKWCCILLCFNVLHIFFVYIGGIFFHVNVICACVLILPTMSFKKFFIFTLVRFPDLLHNGFGFGHFLDNDVFLKLILFFVVLGVVVHGAWCFSHSCL